jgi:hypothetical protein
MCRSPGADPPAADVHVPADLGDLRLELRLDAANHRRAQILAAAEHALQIEKGRDAFDVGLLADALRQQSASRACARAQRRSWRAT